MRVAVLQGTLAELSKKNIKMGSAAQFVDEPEVRKTLIQRTKAQVTVVAADTLDCALWLHEKQQQHQQQHQPLGKTFSVTVLVMASRAHLGGGYKTGAGAQEEHIYRSTSLSLLHESGAHLATEHTMAICNKVRVVRGSERQGYPFVRRFVFFSWFIFG
jgi:hypothetical protein